MVAKHRTTSRGTLAALSLVLVLLLTGWLAPARAAGTGGISGVVFFDANGNGVRDAGEAGLAGVQLRAVDDASQGQNYSSTITSGADGSYSFGALAAGSYVVTETDLAGYVSTSAAARTVNVQSAAVTGIDFGDCLPITLTGIVFDDLNGDGQQGLPEPGVAGALVEVLVDSNANGKIDAGEAVAGSAATDGQGAYVIGGLLPGPRLLRVQRSGGGGLTVLPLTLASSQVSGNTRELDIVLATSGPQVIQQNTLGGAKMAIKKGQRGAQSFRHGVAGGPSYRISQIVLHLSREVKAPNADLVFNISASRYGPVLYVAQVSIPVGQITNTSAGSSFQAYTIVLSPPVGPFTAGATYYLNLVTLAGNGRSYFTEFSTANVYSGGVYYKEQSDSRKDAWFQIWGSTGP